MVFLCLMQADYLIIGQGICGSFLSWYLAGAGKRVMVIDEARPYSASKVASGIINPVTGRRVVRTWMIEELLAFAEDAYARFGRDLGATIASNMDILTFHATQQMSAAWHERMAEGEDYLQHAGAVDEYQRLFNIPHGVGITRPCMLVDINTLMHLWRGKLQATGCLLPERFDIDQCRIDTHGVTYKDITASKILFCNGTSAFDNDYFRRLPFAFSKGEALIASIPGLPPTAIYKQSLNIVPMPGGYFWVGSSFEWEFEDDLPTERFRANTIAQLESWLKLPFKIIDHKAAVRPGSLERRPFVGMHPYLSTVGILGGMGTKGCSLAPYFAFQLAQHLLHGAGINKAADIGRFSRALRR